MSQRLSVLKERPGTLYSAVIMGLFERFNQVGVTLLIASHDLALINSLAYRTLTLDQVRLVADSGTPHAFRA